MFGLINSIVDTVIELPTNVLKVADSTVSKAVSNPIDAAITLSGIDDTIELAKVVLDGLSD
jgi:hypothetical protein